MKKVLVSILLVGILLSTFILPISYASSTYNQVYIKPIQANNNGIDSFPRELSNTFKKIGRKRTY